MSCWSCDHICHVLNEKWYISIFKRSKIATKLDRVVSYDKRLLHIKVTWFFDHVGACRWKTIYVHIHFVYDHQLWQGGGLNQGTTTKNVAWWFDHVLIWVQMVNQIQYVSTSTTSTITKLDRLVDYDMIRGYCIESDMILWSCSHVRSHDKWKAIYLLIHNAHDHQTWQGVASNKGALPTKSCETCVHYFLSNFYFSPTDIPSKTMKILFISSNKLFSFPRYSNFCISVFPLFSPPRQPLL